MDAPPVIVRADRYATTQLYDKGETIKFRLAYTGQCELPKAFFCYICSTIAVEIFIERTRDRKSVNRTENNNVYTE